MTSKWITCFDDEKHAPYQQRPGVYVIIADGTVLYVGQSENVAARIAAYNIRFGLGGSVFTRWGAHRRVAVKVRYTERYGDWLMIEARLIRRLQPKFNIRGCRRAAA